MGNHWHFFRAGGVDQVNLRTAADLLSLPELDQKLWVALAMPAKDVDIDPATLALLDRDHDGRIRVPDVLDAIRWVEKTWTHPEKVLAGGDTLALDDIQDDAVRAAARAILRDRGSASSPTIALDDVVGVAAAFAATTLNGDGIVIPESADDPETRQVIADVIATVGSVADRSGKPGVDEAKLTAFFDEVAALAAWVRAVDADPAARPLGADTEAAAAAFEAVAAKVEDYFTRCRLAGFDARAAAALGAQDADFAALAARVLAPEAEEIARLPLARIEPGRALPLSGDVNPAWAARLETFADKVVTPLLGARGTLDADELRAIAARLAPYLAHRANKPATKVEALGLERVLALAAGDGRAAVLARIEADRALADEYAQIASVEKMLRFQRDLRRVLHNLVNFADFYREGDGVFQAGTLYIDGRACHLCVPVADAARHGALAGMSGAYLAYCDITRGAEKKSIVAAVTNGDADHLLVGRNGVFYDRQGHDWDATITKVVTNPISVREAFWAPYKKLARMIEEQVGKRAAAAEAEADARIAATATSVAHADKAALPAAKPAPRPEPKKIDVGTVAAIGVAIGGIGALVVGVLSTFLGLGLWMPVGLATLLFLISGPSMLLAWMKLRQRNLGPILDANGWAINGRARINVSFGAALTDLARLPPGAKRSLVDPYADKRGPWRLYTTLALLLLLAGTWYTGKLDRYLPRPARSTEVLGEYAPAATPPAPEAPAPAPAPAP